jgi:hypothetical protein
VKKKFKRRSIRLPGYDYSRTGCYFITICSFNQEPIFGKIEDGKIVLLNSNGREIILNILSETMKIISEYVNILETILYSGNLMKKIQNQNYPFNLLARLAAKSRASKAGPFSILKIRKKSAQSTHP